MSPSPNPPGKVRLIAPGGYPNVEISVLNGNYDLVLEAVGKLDHALDPGFYKIRYRAGTAMEEKIVEISPQSEAVRLEAPKWSIKTPAPISDSASSSPDLESIAAALSCQEGIATNGTGSQIFVFVRDTDDDPKIAVPQNPAEGLKLFDFSGKELADFSYLPLHGGCVGCNAEIEPGSYLLRLERTGAESLEQTIVASPGWQTQIFLPLVQLSTSDMVRRPDLSKAAILMSPKERGFDPGEAEYGWVETARQQLAIGRPVVPEKRIRAAVAEANSARQESSDPMMVRQMLRAKFTNPMLGIYAAHIMIMARNRDVDLLREVADNTRLLVGDHPDLMAVYLRLDAKADIPSFVVPPMLRSSWEILIDQSRERENLVPEGSYALRVANRLWGAGAWMVWREPEPELPVSNHLPAPAPMFARVVRAIMSSLATPPGLGAVFRWAREKLTNLSSSQLIQQETQALSLSGLERDVFAYIVNLAEQAKFVESIINEIDRTGKFGFVRTLYRKLVRFDLYKKTLETFVECLSKDGMIRSLRVPQAALTEAIAALETKFARRLPETKSLNATATVRSTQQTDCASWLAPSADGRLELFVRGSDGAVWHIWQTAVNNGWSNWFSHGSPPRVRLDGSPILAPNADRRLQLFVSSADGSLWSIVQTAPSSTWSNWASLGKPASTTLTDSAVVASNADGRLEVFAQGADQALWHIWQTTPNGDWSNWFSHGPPNSGGIQGSLCLAPSQDGRLELFAIGNDGALWHIWQTAVNNGWSNWFSHGNPQGQTFAGSAIPPVLASQADGRLHLFVPSLGGDMWRISQTAANNGWSDWVSHGRPSLFSDPAAIATNADGRLELFIPAGLGVWHIWQTTPNGDWSDWFNQLPDMPNGPVPVDGSPALAPSVDGRLEMFVLGFDKAIWHIWQTAVNNGWSAPFSHGAPPNVQLLPNR